MKVLQYKCVKDIPLWFFKILTTRESSFEMDRGLLSVWFIHLTAGPDCTAEGKDGSQC